MVFTFSFIRLSGCGVVNDLGKSNLRAALLSVDCDMSNARLSFHCHKALGILICVERKRKLNKLTLEDFFLWV